VPHLKQQQQKKVINKIKGEEKKIEKKAEEKGMVPSEVFPWKSIQEALSLVTAT